MCRNQIKISTTNSLRNLLRPNSFNFCDVAELRLAVSRCFDCGKDSAEVSRLESLPLKRRDRTVPGVSDISRFFGSMMLGKTRVGVALNALVVSKALYLEGHSTGLLVFRLVEDNDGF